MTADFSSYPTILKFILFVQRIFLPVSTVSYCTRCVGFKEDDLHEGEKII